MVAILSPGQRHVLDALAGEPAITSAFYLSGGTALAEFHLHHRLSEDFDFFSEEEVEPLAVDVTLKKISKACGIHAVTFETSFNRNLFFLEMETGPTIKTEFTYYPFSRIERGPLYHSLAVDSLRDIAVNKAFTIHQKPRSRDFIDLYCILQTRPNWTLEELICMARAKFDHHIDLLQLAAQCAKADTLKDYPTMVTPLPEADWQTFFLDKAKTLAKSQLG